MAKSLVRLSFWKQASLAVVGMVVTMLVSPLAAQTRDKDGQDMDLRKGELLDAPRGKKSSLIRTGYTRPGNPNDILKDGKVIELAWDDDYKGRYIGGTVYFAVYERTGNSASGDVFGTGFTGIDDLFREGRSTTGQYSPGFDLNARYLYVYQIVNDRGLDPKKEVPIGAGFRDLRSEDVVTATVKLLVEPREITSWGHFTNTGFSARQVDRDSRGKEQLAADGKNDRKLMMAFSSNPSVLLSLPYHEYRSISPALPLHDLRNTFGMERSNLNLKNAVAHKEISDHKAKGVKLVSWQENLLAAAGQGGMEPTFVQILAAEKQESGAVLPMSRYDADGMQELLPVGKNPARGYLKVDWRGDQIVGLGKHSVVFGFTSNLPPVDEVVRLISAAKPVAGGEEQKGITAAGMVDGNGPGVGDGQIVGPGTVPTPIGIISVATVGGGAWLGEQAAGFGGGGGVGVGLPIGGAFFGGPRAPLLGGGGGFGGGNGGGNGNGNGNAGNGNQAGNQNQTINFSATLTNQQAQFQTQNQNQNQYQKQGQYQNQSQNQQQSDSGGGHCCGTPGNVVPEPSAVVLAVLGVPALFVAMRRRKGPCIDTVPQS